MRWAAAMVSLSMGGCLDAPPRSTGAPDAARLDAATAPVLLAAYRFEAEGFLADSSGNGHDGQCTEIQCPVLEVDRGGGGGAAGFDGVDDLVIIQAFGSGAFTVMVWLRLQNDPGGLMCPVNKPFSISGRDTWQLCLRVLSPGVARLYFYTTEETGETFADVPLELGTWHHSAIRWDLTTKTISWDGFDVMYADDITEFDGSDILVGSDIDDGDRHSFFPGSLDDLEIFDGALEEEQIAEAAGL